MWSASSSTRTSVASSRSASLAMMVEQAAGRGDQHFEAAREHVDLRPMRDAADDDADAAPGEELAVSAEALGYLRGELARRARAPARAVAPASGRRGRRRAGARIGKAKAAVLPVPVWAMPSRSRLLKQRRDGLDLDRREFRILRVPSARSSVSGRAEIEKFRQLTSFV